MLFSGLMLFYVGYLLRSASYWGKVAPQMPTAGADLPIVTVIVPARNEAANVAACVKAILAQNYPQDRLELIIVNDHSEDDTVAQARLAADGAPNFRLIDLEAQHGAAYKKAAVACGIAAAAGTIIVTTDADCCMQADWLGSMVAQFDAETALVSGPVVLESDTLFGQFQVLEFMGLIAVGAAGIAAGQPTMCNGANLAYRKSVFEEVGGFSGIDHIASGDDELLMHKIAALGKYRIRFAQLPAAIVHTQAQETWAAFKQQRIRWVSKSTHYKRTGITSTLVLSYLAMVGFPLLLIGGCWDARLWGLMGLHLLLKMLAEFAVLYPAAVFFNKLRLLWWLPLEQVAHIVYVLWVGIAGNRKSYEWKGRNVQ
jgi:cellulose synthase/poly-beta-1,6-N-acetylglucosamine synthase-like glycosyltransferase